MSRSYDMELFLTAVLKGAHATRRRHINQARPIQAAIQQRWQRDNPGRWQLLRADRAADREAAWEREGLGEISFGKSVAGTHSRHMLSPAIWQATACSPRTKRVRRDLDLA